MSEPVYETVVIGRGKVKLAFFMSDNPFSGTVDGNLSLYSEGAGGIGVVAHGVTIADLKNISKTLKKAVFKAEKLQKQLKTGGKNAKTDR